LKYFALEILEFFFFEIVVLFRGQKNCRLFYFLVWVPWRSRAMSIYGDWEGAIGRPLIFSFNFVHRRKALNVPEPLFPRHANLQEAITLTGSLKKV
jgi:hypothetical protein